MGNYNGTSKGVSSQDLQFSSSLTLTREFLPRFTLFNTPHYSTASLLPNDPSPFEVYDCARSQPWPISTFEDYSFPSPLWLWISRVRRILTTHHYGMTTLRSSIGWLIWVATARSRSTRTAGSIAEHSTHPLGETTSRVLIEEVGFVVVVGCV